MTSILKLSSWKWYQYNRVNCNNCLLCYFIYILLKGIPLNKKIKIKKDIAKRNTRVTFVPYISVF